MQKASFQITNYQFNKVLIDASKCNPEDLNVAFETSGIFNTKESSYELNFTVTVSNNKPEEPYVNINCTCFFSFQNVSNVQDIPDFFYRNSIAILFPYVRAYLSLVTTQANVHGILLPTLNLSHLEADLKANTTSF